MPQPAHPATHATSLDRLMHSPARAVPVTVALVVLNVLLFLLMARLSLSPWSLTHADPLTWGANFGPATQDGQWWRLLTAVFVHFSFIHIALNMWALWDVGRLMERLLGRWRYTLLYLGAGTVGNLLSLAVQGNEKVTGGASGAIFGLYGALIVFLWRERRQVDPDEFRWLFSVAIAFSGVMLALGFFIPAIDNAAHGGGLLAGALLGSLLARPWAPGSPLARAQAPWAGALSVLGLLALFASISPPLYRYQEELRARAAIQRFEAEEQTRAARWEALLRAGDRDRLSFDQLAGSLEREIAASYRQSFDQLAAAKPVSAAPSKDALLKLESYAAQRGQAAHNVAQGLRSRNALQIRSGLAQGRNAAAESSAPAPAPESADNEKRP
jgi:rhomboid protease GluP